MGAETKIVVRALKTHEELVGHFTGGLYMTYMVQSRGAKFSCDTVVAPTGYYRAKDGSIVRDGTPSPEMGPIQHAYLFKTHRAAARVAGKLAFPIIREMPNPPVME